MPSKSQHVRIISCDNVDDLKVEDVNSLPEITSIIEDTLVDSGASIIDEVHASSDSISDDVDVIVESSIPIVPNKSFESPCADYGFMVIPELSEFLIMIQ